MVYVIYSITNSEHIREYGEAVYNEIRLRNVSHPERANIVKIYKGRWQSSIISVLPNR